MATNITNLFDSIYLTSHLPENVYIGTDQQQITVTVEVDGDTAFSSVYYPLNQVVTFRDLRSIVEAAMDDQALDIATLEIWAHEPTGKSTAVQDVKVIASSVKTPYGTEAFLKSSFLTTRKSALVPRNEFILLYNYAWAYTQENNYVQAFYTVPYVPNLVFEHEYSLGKVQATSDRIVITMLSHDTFKNVVDKISANSTVLGAEYHIGGRAFNIFFTDEKPTDVFTFLNAFGISEKVFLFGATTTKTEVDRSEAVIGRNTQFYDETVNVKHEVETAPLPYDEALWMQQMFYSKYVTRRLSNGSTARVLISDITAEVSDSDKELTRQKFSWKYADGIEWL